LTNLSEDSEVSSKAISDISGEVDRAVDEVLPYLFEPERYSDAYSEPEDVVVDTSGEEQIGNTDWYVTKITWA